MGALIRCMGPWASAIPCPQGAKMQGPGTLSSGSACYFGIEQALVDLEVGFQFDFQACHVATSRGLRVSGGQKSELQLCTMTTDEIRLVDCIPF